MSPLDMAPDAFNSSVWVLSKFLRKYRSIDEPVAFVLFGLYLSYCDVRSPSVSFTLL